MKKISSDSISELISAEDQALSRLVQQGRSKAISWMGLQRKPSGRVADYLKLQGFDQAIILRVLESLKEDDYIDDERLAGRIVRQRSGRQSESRAAMSQRMTRLGLDKSAIESVLPDAETDYSAACTLLESRFSKQLADLKANGCNEDPLAIKSRYELTRKLARFLASRGFSSSTIGRALRKYSLGIDSMD